MHGATLTLCALLVSAACERPLERPPLGRQEYVDTYVEILLASDEAENRVAASEAAAKILERRGISQDDLLEYARFYENDPAYLANVWMEIEMRLRNPEPDSGSAEGRTGQTGRKQ